MKKILFTLLLFTGYLQAQTYPVNPTKFGKISLNTNVKQNDATRVIVQDSITKELNWVLKSSISGGQTTDDIENTSFVSGDNATEALNYLSANKENTYNKATNFTTVNNTLYPTVQAVKTALDLKANTSDLPILQKDPFIFTGSKIFTLSQPSTNILSVVVDGKQYYDTGTNIQFRMNSSTELEILEELTVGEDINVVVTYNYIGSSGLNYFPKFKTFENYEDSLSEIPETSMKILRIIDDEDKGYENTIYYLYPDGTRLWIASSEN